MYLELKSEGWGHFMKDGKKLKMKELPASERPYEKLEKSGAEALSDAELMAIIIKTGSKTETSVAVAQKLLKQGSDEGLNGLHELSLEQLKKISGIGRVKALQIKAVMELSKRAALSGMGDKIVIKCPEDVSRIMMEEMRHLKKEVFKVILLNTKNRIIRTVVVSTGSLNASIVHPREAFSEAVKSGASCVIFVHNHPSGDPEPSKEDIETTGRLTEAGNVLGIGVIDHIILGNGKYISLKEKGFI